MLFCLYFIMKLYTISPNILYTILPVHTLAVARFFRLLTISDKGRRECVEKQKGSPLGGAAAGGG